METAKITSLNLPDHYGKTSLHYAVTNNLDISIVQRLLEHGVDPNKRDSNGNTSLHLCIDDPFKVALLLRHDADPNIANDGGFMPLHLAAKDGKVDSMEILLKHGAEVNSGSSNGVIYAALGTTALHLAAARRDVAMIELLFKFDADPNVMDTQGDTPLHVFFKNHKLKRLSSTSLSALDRVRETSEWVGTIRKFLAKGFKDCPNADGNTLLHLTIEYMLISVVDLLLQVAPEKFPFSQNFKGETALHVLLKKSGLEANPNSLDLDAISLNSSHLSMSEAEKMLEVKRKNIIGLFPKINQMGVADQDGNTLLHLAAKNCYYETLRYLVSLFDSLCGVNSQGDTFVHLMIKSRDWKDDSELIEIIKVSIGKDQNLLSAVDWDGRTLLHIALQKGSNALLKVLLP
ncbi:hypothetical protein QAD02_006435 [Eretmocerus hayati]|uniref:Uncharacterized protein n=1 Tax=Eretmocerus hayati TaxID=131215 RepID=A0ACC2N1Z2_9HYME|nr:hypothetical protein QAD02_006435 [Eretmocerus hayati]